jgi:hypothetical protein
MVEQVIWPLHAQTQLAKAYNYILQHSWQNAEKVKAEILEIQTK